MDLELVKFINSDLTWTSVKKGHRTMKKRPKKPTTSNSDVTAFDYEKSGVAILGQHFGEEVLDVPIKKRILMLQSQLPAAHHELPEKSKNKSTPIPDLNDFSGIELLAAAASVYEEHTTPIPTPKVDSYTECGKDEIAPVASDDSSVQDPHPEKGDKTSKPSKDVRFNWDLNIVMDEWEQEQEQEQEQEEEEEQCCDILVDPHSEKGYSKDNSKNEEKKLESCEITNSGDQEQEQEQVKSVSEVVQGDDGHDDDDDKVISEDRLSDCCGSNTVDKVEKTTGYESPVEDGELRDTWQKENELEEMECVDYESSNIYEDNFDTTESVSNEVIATKSEAPVNEIEQVVKTKVPEHSISQEKDRIVVKNDSCIPRSRSDNFGDSYSRGKRDFGQEKSTYNNWDSRNSQRYSSRPKHVIGSRNSQPVSYNPRGSYKTFYTRPERNNESYRGTGTQPTRENSRERFKSGLGFHPRREEYNEPDLYHSERKVSSFSHISRSRRRSRSRSRSESPIAWNFQKKRNIDTKIESQDYNKVDTRFQGDKRASFQENLGRLKSSDNFYPTSRSGRFPQGNSQHDGQYGTFNGGGRFRYSVDESLSFKTHNKDNGFRYGRNEKAYRYHKDDFQRE